MFSSCLSNFGFLVKQCFYYESAGSAQIVITFSSAGSLSAGSLSAGVWLLLFPLVFDGSLQHGTRGNSSMQHPVLLEPLQALCRLPCSLGGQTSIESLWQQLAPQLPVRPG